MAKRRRDRLTMNEYVKRAREVIDVEIQGLEKVREQMDTGFAAAVEMMLKCLKENGKIVVTGIGKNLHIAQKISATLASTGATSLLLNPAQAMHGDLGVLSKGDVLLVLSYSGESEEILMLIPPVKRIDVKIVGMTGDAGSSLAGLSDVVIPVTVEREACPFNMAPTASTTACLAAGDALAMVLLDARGLKKEDYAKLHPGGAIGRALLMRVSDIMRKDERLAVLKRDAKVKDAVIAITQARSGSAAVVDESDGVVGIVTDGDLRRHLTENANLMDLKVEEVMTPSPITLKADQLAISVLRLFEDHNIDDLLVVDDAGKLVGAVDIQDLPKFKIL
jgi:arabinose-5-phosphate isomerase